MSVSLETLSAYCNELLSVQQFNDYCPNGLQVEGRTSVRRIVAGVSACQALLDAAVAVEADLVLVHHGYFWKGESPCITGMKKRRLQTLLQRNIGLLAYHLPLDAHPVLGNNAQLAHHAGWQVDTGLGGEIGQAIGLCGQLDRPMAASDLAAQLHLLLGRKPQHIAVNEHPVQRLAWCSGAAQGYIEQAWQAGAEVFISGEISEQTVHFARENGIDYIAAGHHATERYGVQALAEHLARQFSLDCQFIDIANPV